MSARLQHSERTSAGDGHTSTATRTGAVGSESMTAPWIRLKRQRGSALTPITEQLASKHECLRARVKRSAAAIPCEYSSDTGGQRDRCAKAARADPGQRYIYISRRMRDPSLGALELAECGGDAHGAEAR